MFWKIIIVWKGGPYIVHIPNVLNTSEYWKVKTHMQVFLKRYLFISPCGTYNKITFHTARVCQGVNLSLCLVS